MKKVTITPGCISCGMCEQNAPEVFYVPDTAQVKEGVDIKMYENKIREAAKNCPVKVIKVEE